MAPPPLASGHRPAPWHLPGRWQRRKRRNRLLQHLRPGRPGRAYRRPPYKTNSEANIFRRGRTEHLIDTPLGRIGIGICADNQFAAQLRTMHDQHADLVLMPHAWPTPARPGGLVSEVNAGGRDP